MEAPRKKRKRVAEPAAPPALATSETTKERKKLGKKKAKLDPKPAAAISSDADAAPCVGSLLSGVKGEAGSAGGVGLGEEDEEETDELFIRHCPRVTEDRDLYLHYAPLGADAIRRIKWVRVNRSKLNDHAFVTFKSPSIATAALEMAPPKVGRRLLNVERARRTSFTECKHQLMLRGLPTFITEDRIRYHYRDLDSFTPGASAVESILWNIQAGSTKGCVFIGFRKREQLEKALELGPPETGGHAVLVEETESGASPDKIQQAKADRRHCELYMRPVYPKLTNEVLMRHYGAENVLDIRRWKYHAWLVFPSQAHAEEALKLPPPRHQGTSPKNIILNTIDEAKRQFKKEKAVRRAAKRSARQAQVTEDTDPVLATWI